MTTTETFRIQTQHLENYDVDGASDCGHWKFKMGTDYRVTVPMSDHSRQNALAAVARVLASEAHDLGVSYIVGDTMRVPTDWLPSDDEEDEGYGEFLDECLKILEVS